VEPKLIVPLDIIFNALNLHNARFDVHCAIRKECLVPGAFAIVVKF